ncbi:MAG: ABC transporter permease [Myxococcota bacterium]
MNAGLGDLWALTGRELRRYARDRAYWVGQIVFPLAFVGFIGFGLNDVVDLPSGTSYVGHLATGLLALLVGSGAVGGGFSLIEDKTSGFLRALLVAPVARIHLVLAKLISRTLLSLVLVAGLGLLLALFTPVRIHDPVAGIVAVVAITAIFVALGVTLAVPLRRLESFRLIAALVTVPLYLFSGIFYPVSTLPAPTRWLSVVNPLTYGVDLLRYALLGVHELPVGRSLVLLCGLTALAIALAAYAFDRGTRG